MAERDLSQEVETLRQQLAEARAALGEFAYVVSHDLRAQLRHIVSYSSLLREELGSTLQGDSRQFLQTVSDAAQTMGRQIDGLKEWVQLDRVELQPMAVDLGALLTELQRKYVTLAQTEGRALRWNVAPEMPRVQADGVLMRQLLDHVLSNAVKFTRMRSEAVVDIAAEVAAGGVTLTVRDNGVGYNPAQQDQFFHVFKRLHSSSQFEGLGLGLALAQKIAQRHGGDIRLEGAVDAGCCVRITLPA